MPHNHCFYHHQLIYLLRDKRHSIIPPLISWRGWFSWELRAVHNPKTCEPNAPPKTAEVKLWTGIDHPSITSSFWHLPILKSPLPSPTHIHTGEHTYRLSHLFRVPLCCLNLWRIHQFKKWFTYTFNCCPLVILVFRSNLLIIELLIYSKAFHFLLL